MSEIILLIYIRVLIYSFQVVTFSEKLWKEIYLNDNYILTRSCKIEWDQCNELSFSWEWKWLQSWKYKFCGVGVDSTQARPNIFTKSYTVFKPTASAERHLSSISQAWMIIIPFRILFGWFNTKKCTKLLCFPVRNKSVRYSFLEIPTAGYCCGNWKKKRTDSGNSFLKIYELCIYQGHASA
jgi:hypothetical protein